MLAKQESILGKSVQLCGQDEQKSAPYFCKEVVPTVENQCHEALLLNLFYDDSNVKRQVICIFGDPPYQTTFHTTTLHNYIVNCTQIRQLYVKISSKMSKYFQKSPKQRPQPPAGWHITTASITTTS